MSTARVAGRCSTMVIFRYVGMPVPRVRSPRHHTDVHAALVHVVSSPVGARDSYSGHATEGHNVRFMQHLRLRHRLVLAAATAVLAAGAGALVAAQPAQAHGTMLIPGSRTWLCYQDALQPNGQLTANNPACAAALAKSGTTSLYNW